MELRKYADQTSNALASLTQMTFPSRLCALSLRFCLPDEKDTETELKRKCVRCSALF